MGGKESHRCNETAELGYLLMRMGFRSSLELGMMLR